MLSMASATFNMTDEQCFYRTSALRRRRRCCVSNKLRREETARGSEIRWEEQLSFSETPTVYERCPESGMICLVSLETVKQQQADIFVSISITLLKLQAQALPINPSGIFVLHSNIQIYSPSNILMWEDYSFNPNSFMILSFSVVLFRNVKKTKTHTKKP